MKKKFKYLIAHTALFVTLFFIAGLAFNGENLKSVFAFNDAQLTPQYGKELIIAQNADAVSLDPALSADMESAKITACIFEGLVAYKDDSTEIKPLLASSWEILDNGKIWIFHLCKNVKFHDGTPFNADAVVFSFLRQIDTHHPFYREDFRSADFAFKYVKFVEAKDEYTVKFCLEKPFAPFLYNLAMAFASPVVSPAAIKKWGNEFEKHPVGTGPFIFENRIPGDRVILKKNPDYRDNLPYIDKLVFRTIPNISMRFKEFQRGNIHVMDGINPVDVKSIEQLPDGRLSIQPGLTIGYLAMNTQKPPFDNVKVRQAVNYAINKENLVRLIYKGLAIKAKNPIPPSLWGYNDKIDDYEYMPEKARDLLKQAGYDKGFKTKLFTMTVSRPYMPQPAKVARAIKGNLAGVGIMVDIEYEYDWKEYIKKVKNGEHEMCMFGWIGDNGDPDNFFYVLLDKDNAVKPWAKNLAFFKNEELHTILIKAQQISDRQERINLYMQAQEIIHAQAPWVPIAHNQQVGAYLKNVHDLVFHTTGIIKYYRAWIE